MRMPILHMGCGHCSTASTILFARTIIHASSLLVMVSTEWEKYSINWYEVVVENYKTPKCLHFGIYFPCITLLYAANHFSIGGVVSMWSWMPNVMCCVKAYTCIMLCIYSVTNFVFKRKSSCLFVCLCQCFPHSRVHLTFTEWKYAHPGLWKGDR